MREKDFLGRKDLRDLQFVTIDGETARDFDDAVFARREGKGWRLWVAIADVSHYVRPGDALDHDARERGNSVYFPRRVIPMLPEKLSNGLCSLNPNVERLAMVCEMAITPQGEVANYEFYAAVFRSRARLTYTEVWRKLSGGKAPQDCRPCTTCSALHAERNRRGAIDFDTVETRMIFDPRARSRRSCPRRATTRHRIIEECMLAANVCAGNFLAGRKQPVLYRVHDVPAADKVAAALRQFLAELGLDLPGGEIPRAQGLRGGQSAGSAPRRAVKQAVEAADAEARAQLVAAQLVNWYNQHVGVSMVQYARLGRGRRLHILDTTHVEVALETGTYECSGVVKNDDGTYSRGYKLATLRTLLDSAGLLTHVALSAIQVHDLALCRPLAGAGSRVASWRSTPRRSGAFLMEQHYQS